MQENEKMSDFLSEVFYHANFFLNVKPPGFSFSSLPTVFPCDFTLFRLLFPSSVVIFVAILCEIGAL